MPDDRDRASRASALSTSLAYLQNSMLIALSGVDGSGKSTQACALRDAFEAGHVRSRIVWTRIGDTPLLRRLHAARKRYAQSTGTPTQRTFSRTGWRLVLWAIVACADYAAWLQYVRWRLWRGDVVLADRYLCDFEVELGIRLRHEPHLAALLLRVLRSLAPTPQRAYLLQIDPALSRKRTTESGVGDLDPAAMQRRYDALTHRYGLRACDASRPLDDLAAELVHDALTTYVNTPTLKRWACDGGDNVRGAPRGLAGREPAVQPLHGATDSASEGRSPSHSA